MTRTIGQAFHPRSLADRHQAGSVSVVVVAAVLGAALGLGFYTFVYARGFSYMLDDASACTNCHVMREQYAAWSRASHRSVAVCNDCHTPPGLVAKYATKASNGFRHSWAFTLGRFETNIQITPRNHDVTEAACRECHGDVVEVIELGTTRNEALSCLSCHGDVGHLY
jgi:cytochrome c nitrite reductase small subunit